MGVRLRLLCLALVVVNVLVFIFFRVRTAPNEAAALRIEEVQINAGSVKLLGATTRGAGQPGGGAVTACLEWAPISSENVPAADSALERLSLGQPPIRRPLAASGGTERFAYFLKEPDPATVARVTELQRTFPETQITAGACPEDVAGAASTRERAR